AGARARLGSLRFVQPEPVRNIAVLPDGKTVVTRGWGGFGDAKGTTVRFWDAASGRHLRVIEDPRLFRTEDYRTGYRVVSEYRRRGRGGEERHAGVEVFDVSTGRRLRRVGDVPGLIRAIAVSPGGKFFAVVGAHDQPFACAFELWDAATGKGLRTFEAKAPW